MSHSASPLLTSPYVALAHFPPAPPPCASLSIKLSAQHRAYHPPPEWLAKLIRSVFSAYCYHSGNTICN
jgi:hypothetical protein